MQSDGQALLRAIIEAPDDDAPRGIYADWLDENAGHLVCGGCLGGKTVTTRTRTAEMGPDDYGLSTHACWDCHGTGTVTNGYAERAEFIRASVALAEGHLLRVTRMRELLKAHCERWASGLPGTWIDLGGLGFRRQLTHASAIFEWGRGMVELAEMSAADWIAHGQCIVSQHPIRRVVLSDARARPLEPDERLRHGGPGWTVRVGGLAVVIVHPGTNSALVGLLSQACLAWARREGRGHPSLLSLLETLATDGATQPAGEPLLAVGPRPGGRGARLSLTGPG